MKCFDQRVSGLGEFCHFPKRLQSGPVGCRTAKNIGFARYFPKVGGEMLDAPDEQRFGPSTETVAI